MKFDYVDIGTSDFDTSADILKSGQKALLVEPVKYYLDKLPVGPGIFKKNAAVSCHKGKGKMYYVTDEVIKRYNLPNWIRGCNSFNQQHGTVVNIFEKLGLSLNLVTCEDVPVITFFDLIKEYNIKTIEFLKIDTEGHDHIILRSVMQAMRKGLKIKQIRVEYNPFFGNTRSLDLLITKSSYVQAYLVEDNAIINF